MEEVAGPRWWQVVRVQAVAIGRSAAAALGGAVTLTVLAWLGLVTPERLLALCFVIGSGMALASHFGDGSMRAQDVASGLVGAVVKDPVQDQIAWEEYLEAVVKDRSGWKDLYRACKDLGPGA